ncbi:hypothetical protein [Nocardia sp. NPDC051833]|uniref:hypothetical protein n=1 Tax=Nocardia sp. NPDC051833 TaxID=3155674 RepID=UPI00342655E3
MSADDSKQLSVAELLARNAAQGASPPASGGGGRRRRSGRGLSVNDLTGENAAVRPNSHAAPSAEPEPPAYQPEPAPAYEPPASYQPAPYPPPGPAEPAYSPMSGPITRFDPQSGFSAPDPSDPLGVAGQRPSADPFGPYRAEARDSGSRGAGRGPGRLGAPSSAQPVDPGIAEMFGSGALPAVGGGRRRRAEPDEAPEPAPLPEPPQAPPATGGRAARRRAAEAAEEAAAAPAPWTPDASGYAAPTGFEPPAPAPDTARGFPGRQDSGSGFGGFPAPGGAAPGFNAFPEFGPRADIDATQAYNAPPAPDVPQARGTGWPAPEAEQRPSLDRRRPGPDAGKTGGLPSWSARRHRPDPAPSAPESGGFPTAAWSPVSQEQPLISGQSVAGDLLRQQADDADARTEVYRVGGNRAAEPDTDDYAESDYVDRDYADNDYSDTDYTTGDYDTGYDDDDYDDYEPEPKPTRASRRAATKAAASKVASRAKSRAASRVAATRASGRFSQLARGATEDDNRRQWLILGGQSVGAAIAGMLLFKGFETMWETLPWVALALAMVVILGLVALVRILRRTDDIYSTVIAVVVGVFVTLGPLAFLLSTS